MTAQNENHEVGECSIVLRPDKSGGSFVALAPALFVFLGVISFQESFAEWFELFGSLQLAVTLWIVLTVIIGGIRQNPRRYFKSASDLRYFLMIASGLVLIFLGAHEAFVEAGFQILFSTGIGWINGLIGFTIWVLQILLFAESVRVGLSWRPGLIMSWAPSVGKPPENSNIANSDNIISDVPTVEQLQGKLSSLSGDPRNTA
ncbi:hypothetical protein [Hyphococcus sp.]|uniref:hypothetical protein n=1 Tax=Hyphococcus sp. TaxID=2038636 RepID=UPI0037526737